MKLGRYVNPGKTWQHHELALGYFKQVVYHATSAPIFERVALKIRRSVLTSRHVWRLQSARKVIASENAIQEAMGFSCGV